MEISGMGAKLAAGAGATTAVVAPTTAGIMYKDEIGDFFAGKREDRETNEKLRTLGIPDKCNFAEGDSFKECNGLTLDVLKTVNFLDKGDGETLEMEGGGTVKLKIEKVQNKTAFPEGLKFTFTATKDLKAKPASAEGKVILQKEKEIQFKIKIEGNKSKLERVAAEEDEATKKMNGINEKLKSLGIPSECYFAKGNTSKECSSLDLNKVKTINFSDKSSGGTLAIKDSGTVGLKIEENGDKTTFPEGLKFTFTSTKDLEDTPASGGSAKVLLKEGIGYEFRKSKTENKLERVWTIETLKEKLGFESCDTTNNKECTLKKDGLINIWGDNSNDKVIGAKVKEAGKKIKFQLDQSGFNQGVKFKVEEANGISLIKAEGTSSEVKMENSKEYEIKFDNNKFFFNKKN